MESWELELQSLSHLSDEEAAEVINSIMVRPKKQEAWVSYRTFAVIPGLGLLAGQRLIDKLNAVMQQPEPIGDDDALVLARAFRRNIGYMADPKSLGIDVANPEVREGLQLAVGFGGITQQEIQAVLDYGHDSPRPKYPPVDASMVAIARGKRPLVQHTA